MTTSEIFSIIFDFLGQEPYLNINTLSELKDQPVPRSVDENHLTENLEKLISALKAQLETLKQKNLSCGSKHDSPEEKIEEENTSNAGHPKSNMSDLVQIRASRSEINRRIAAFIEKKRVDVDELNRREFCNVMKPDPEGSCARTDAMFISRADSKSHVKVTQVVNKQGPQTQSSRGRAMDLVKRRRLMDEDSSNHSKTSPIEERLQAMEEHLQMHRGESSPETVYERIQRLEDRILQLEGLSPEYFHKMPPVAARHENMHSKQRRKPLEQNFTATEIDDKILALKSSLLGKVKQKTEPS